jgi:Raf kinase inhibitor-like YbhB/YbcL family protein
LVLIVEDIDADPKPWTHWLVFDIPPTTTFVGEGEVPAGGHEGLANGGTPGYEGPCPKYFSDVHHYAFRLIALDVELGLPSATTKSAIVTAMKGHIITEATLIGVCQGKIK